jgi:hypothetical protein
VLDLMLPDVSGEESVLRGLEIGADGSSPFSARHEVRKDGRQVPLTPNEYKLLMMMGRRPTRAFAEFTLLILLLSAYILTAS